MSNNNPFEFLQSFMNQEKLSDFMKNCTKNIDPATFNEALKESSENIAATNQLVSDSLQMVAKKSADAFQKNTSEMFNAMQEALSAGDVKQMSNCHHNYLKSTMQNNIDSTKEMLDITSKSSSKIFDVFAKNISNNLQKNSQK